MLFFGAFLLRDLLESQMDTLDILATSFSLARLNTSQRDAYGVISVELSAKLARYTYQECKGTPSGSSALHDLFELAQSSGFSLSEWISGIVEVYQWLEQKDLDATFVDVIQYVSCACHGSGGPYEEGVLWYLENFGFERAKPSPSRGGTNRK
jgi:hypothetical protein